MFRSFFLLILFSMATKGTSFSLVLSETPIITLDKLVGSTNYLSWVDSMQLWFIGNGYEDHLTTTNDKISKDKCSQWRQIDALLYNILCKSIDT